MTFAIFMKKVNGGGFKLHFPFLILVILTTIIKYNIQLKLCNKCLCTFKIKCQRLTEILIVKDICSNR